MTLHLRATGCHLPYGITQCYLSSDTSENTQPYPSKRPVLDLPTPEGWKAELTYVTGYIPRWFNRTLTVTHLSTNPAAHGRESNSRPVDHMSDALTAAAAAPPVQFTLQRQFSEVVSKRSSAVAVIADRTACSSTIG